MTSSDKPAGAFAHLGRPSTIPDQPDPATLEGIRSEQELFERLARVPALRDVREKVGRGAEWLPEITFRWPGPLPPIVLPETSWRITPKSFPSGTLPVRSAPMMQPMTRV